MIGSNCTVAMENANLNGRCLVDEGKRGLRIGAAAQFRYATAFASPVIGSVIAGGK